MSDALMDALKQRWINVDEARRFLDLPQLDEDEDRHAQMSELASKLVLELVIEMVEESPLFEEKYVSAVTKEVNSKTLAGMNLPPRHRVEVVCDGAIINTGLKVWTQGREGADKVFALLVAAHPKLCQKCCKNRKLDDDYICEACRYGT